MSAATLPGRRAVASSSARRSGEALELLAQGGFHRAGARRAATAAQRGAARSPAAARSVASARRRRGCGRCRAGTGATPSAPAARAARRRRRCSSASVPCSIFCVRPRDSASSTASTSSPRGEQLAARARSRARASRRPARCSAWISGTVPRWSSQCTKLCTPVSMIASACCDRGLALLAGASAPAPTGRRRCRGRRRRQARDLGLDVARHGQVDHEHRAVAARLQRALDGAQADDRQRTGGAGHHDVELGQARRQVGQAHRLGAEARRQLLAALERAVGHRHRASAARAAKWVADQLDHLAGADEQHLGARAGPRTAARPAAPPRPPC